MSKFYTCISLGKLRKKAIPTSKTYDELMKIHERMPKNRTCGYFLEEYTPNHYQLFSIGAHNPYTDHLMEILCPKCQCRMEIVRRSHHPHASHLYRCPTCDCYEGK